MTNLTSDSWQNMPNSTLPPMASTTLNVTSTTEHVVSPEDIGRFWVGFSLAVISNAFTGSSFIFKKRGLIKIAKKQNARADAGGYGYLKEWLWWLGMGLMIFGEVLNFSAYLFAPASLVTPLGAFSVIVAAVLSSIFLKERLNLIGKVSCGLCVLGSTIMVMHAPQETEIRTMDELLDKVQEPGFIVICLFFLILGVVFIIVMAPKYGSKYVLVYVIICSSFGAFTVMACKGVGVALTQTTRGDQQFTNWFTYVNLAVLIVCVLIELNFLNRALDIYNTAVVTPIYYVIFTTFAVTLSSVLYKDFFYMHWKDIATFFIGFIVIVCGIFLLNAFKNMDISIRNLPKARKKESERDENANLSLNGDVIMTQPDEEDDVSPYRRLPNSQSLATMDIELEIEQNNKDERAIS